MIKKVALCQLICKKVGVTRVRPCRSTLDKRELLHVNSLLDVVANVKSKEG